MGEIKYLLCNCAVLSSDPHKPCKARHSSPHLKLRSCYATVGKGKRKIVETCGPTNDIFSKERQKRPCLKQSNGKDQHPTLSSDLHVCTLAHGYPLPHKDKNKNKGVLKKKIKNVSHKQPNKYLKDPLRSLLAMLAAWRFVSCIMKHISILKVYITQ